MSDEFTTGATTPETTAEVVTEQTPAVESDLAQWVGEGKKYATPDDLAKAYKNADQRIEELRLDTERLTSEKAELEAKSKGVEDVLAAIQNQTTQTIEQSVPVVQTEVSPDINVLVDQRLAEHQANADKQTKVSTTWSMMDEAFGSRAAASLAVQSYMGDDPAKKAIINNLAISDPAGLMKLIGKDVEKVATTFTSDHSSGGGEVNLEGTLTWETAQQVRKKDPKQYYSHAFKQRMINEIPRK
jgi:hypothetical protein